MSDPISSRPLTSGLKQTGPLSSPTPPSPAAAVAPSGAEAQRPPAALVDDASGAQGELAAGPAEVELPPPPPPPPSEGRLLRRGQRGPEIAALQRRLTELGVSPSPGEADGVWGERTQAAVLAFQRAQGLEPDGLVGPLTRAALAAAQVPPLPLPPPAPPGPEGGSRPTPPEPPLPTPPVPPAPEAGPRPVSPEPPRPTPPVPPRPQPGPRPAPPPPPLPTPPVPPAPEAGPRPAPPAPPRPQPGPRPAPPAPPRPQPGPRPAPPEPPLPTPPVPPPPAPPEPPRPQPGPRPAPPAPPRGGARAQRAEPTPPRSQPVIPVEQSLATSAQILLQGGPGITSGGPVREITRVPLSPQAGYQMDRAARAAAENAPLVTERMAALNEADRQHFLALMNPLPGGARLDATAVLALQRMLLENRLPGPANAEGRNLLAELVRVGTDAPLAPGVSRSDLISQTLREVAVPASINQGGYGTCAMSSVQIAVASRDPAEYLRLAAGLASPARQVTMRNGQALTLPPGAGPQPDPSHPPGSQHPQPGRSLPTRMLAPALMQLGAQSLNPRQNYNPTIDRMVDAGQRQTYGMYMSAVQAAVLAVQGPRGTARELHTVQPGSPSADRLVARIQAATQGGELVPVSMAWGALDATGNHHAAHAVVVQRIEGDRVHILNPWGQAERFTLAEFRARLIEGVVPTR